MRWKNERGGLDVELDQCLNYSLNIALFREYI